MRNGSIVRLDGDLFKKIDGQWVLLAPDPDVWYPDEWVEIRNYEVIAEASPLADVADGTVVASACSSVVAVYQGAGDWTISGYEAEFTTDEMLAELGRDWKIIYKVGENNE